MKKDNKENIEEQHTQREMIKILLKGIAHDLNNLLNNIQGYTELALLKIDETHPAYHDLENVLNTCHEMAVFLRKLQLFSREKMEETTIFNLNEIIIHSKVAIQRSTGDTVSVETQLAPDLWPIKGDIPSIQQMIMDLVSNAREAMPQGGTLVLKTENTMTCTGNQIPKKHNGKFVLLSVCDTGQGMTPEVKKRIFEPFFRKGIGLGLAVAHKIVKQHEGWIEVHSALGEGSTFKVYLPAAQETDNQ